VLLWRNTSGHSAVHVAHLHVYLAAEANGNVYVHHCDFNIDSSPTARQTVVNKPPPESPVNTVSSEKLVLRLTSVRVNKILVLVSGSCLIEVSIT
jgi:hypothetical protein